MRYTKKSIASQHCSVHVLMQLFFHYRGSYEDMIFNQIYQICIVNSPGDEVAVCYMICINLVPRAMPVRGLGLALALGKRNRPA